MSGYCARKMHVFVNRSVLLLVGWKCLFYLIMFCGETNYCLSNACHGVYSIMRFFCEVTLIKNLMINFFLIKEF